MTKPLSLTLDDGTVWPNPYIDPRDLDEPPPTLPASRPASPPSAACAVRCARWCPLPADPTLSTRPFPADVTCTGVRWGGPPRADGEPSHRATLDLGWPSLTASRGCLHVSMLNPSGASRLASDATITRVIGFARAGGYSGVRITNRFRFRATKPSEMAAAIRRGEDVGEDQDWEEMLATGSDLLVGWGRPSSALLRRRLQNSTGELVARWRRHGMRLLALDLTEDGWPRHPLMLPSASVLREVEWSAAEAGFVWR